MTGNRQGRERMTPSIRCACGMWTLLRHTEINNGERVIFCVGCAVPITLPRRCRQEP